MEKKIRKMDAKAKKEYFNSLKKNQQRRYLEAKQTTRRGAGGKR